jgi:Hydrazine synthase alpha subunit middle domain
MRTTRAVRRPGANSASMLTLVAVTLVAGQPLARGDDAPDKRLNLDPPHISTDHTIKYDYDILYVRILRDGPKPKVWAQAGVPLQMNPGADLMLLHPDGSEEVLVHGGKGSVTDPIVSFDGEWVYYSLFHDLTRFQDGFAPSAADIYKIHVRTRKIVRLTNGGFSPNTGAAQWADDFRTPQPGKTTMPYPVCNTGPCPLPGGRVIFTSNRNGFISPRPTNNGFNVNLQLFVMDDDGGNVEQIGHLNIGAALHPVVLRDGRVMFSTLENQGQRDTLSWGLWSINPDGTNWDPIISSFISTAFHFQTQLSDGDVVAGAYYGGVGTQGFCTYVKVPVERTDYPHFGPAYREDPRNGPAFPADLPNRQRTRLSRVPFSPLGMQQLTCFADDGDDTAARLTRDGPWVGKVTHPSAAPDNHLLTIWNARPTGDHDVDAGIYLIKSGRPISEPGQMLLIKQDPVYDAQWPRALVPYKRIHGVDEPRSLTPLANDGTLSPHLPEGTPFGLVGTSSLYKRESFPDGRVAEGSVTATWPGGDRPIPFDLGGRDPHYQGGDAGLYANEDIHAIRFVILEPTTNRRNGPKAGRLFRSMAMERMRILGEIPVRKFGQGTEAGAQAVGTEAQAQPLDPDGNPDTSFLAKIPADVAWTFQTLDKDGMVLNAAQTWHQVRPGEVRTNCGGCHAHSQKPTAFEKTAAAQPDYPVFDLTKETPLLTDKASDQSGRQWDRRDETGLRFEKHVKNVEYLRDIKPILDRSCTACHTKRWEKPAGNLVLDDNQPEDYSGMYPQAQLPSDYFRLVMDHKGKYGYKPPGSGSDGYGRGSRYVWPLQSRRSLLTWKIFGRRTDGFSNDDFPIETVPGDPDSLRWKGQPVANTPRNRKRSIVGYTGSIMPPPEAVAGAYVGPDGSRIKVPPLSDEDRRTIVRWIDLGCPIDLDYDPSNPQDRGYGWMQDDNRPTLTMTLPKPGTNGPLTRVLIGMYDYDTGLDMESFRVVADMALDGVPAGQNLAPKFQTRSQGVWEMVFSEPLNKSPQGRLTISVKDRQGNITRVEQTFFVVANP